LWVSLACDAVVHASSLLKIPTPPDVNGRERITYRFRDRHVLVSLALRRHSCQCSTYWAVSHQCHWCSQCVSGCLASRHGFDCAVTPSAAFTLSFCVQGCFARVVQLGHSGSEPIGCQLRFALAATSHTHSLTRSTRLFTHSHDPLTHSPVHLVHSPTCTTHLPVHSYDLLTHLLAQTGYSLTRTTHSLTHLRDPPTHLLVQPTHSLTRTAHSLVHSYSSPTPSRARPTHSLTRTNHPLAHSYDPPGVLR
jgi:hypothetical protein